MQFPEECSADVLLRLRRLEGQIRGIHRLVDEEADCADIVTQLAAAQGAMDRIGFRLMASALTTAQSDDELAELEALFLKLA